VIIEFLVGLLAKPKLLNADNKMKKKIKDKEKTERKRNIEPARDIGSVIKVFPKHKAKLKA